MHQRPDAIMNGYQSIVLYLLQSFSNRLKAGVSSLLKNDRFRVIMLFTERFPGSEIGFRQHEDDSDRFRIAEKSIHRMHQNGQAVNFQELLGQIGIHPCALSAGYD